MEWNYTVVRKSSLADLIMEIGLLMKQLKMVRLWTLC